MRNREKYRASRVLPLERLWDRVVACGECMEYTMSINSNGYGSFRYDGVTYGAHVVAYALSHGLHPQQVMGVVMHTCHNRKCCNPQHLQLGTQSDNIRQGVALGTVRGGNNPYRNSKGQYCHA